MNESDNNNKPAPKKRRGRIPGQPSGRPVKQSITFEPDVYASLHELHELTGTPLVKMNNIILRAFFARDDVRAMVRDAKNGKSLPVFFTFGRD